MATRIVRATIRPDNLLSLALIRQSGFSSVGEQWDDDGPEIVFKRRVGTGDGPDVRETVQES